MTNSILLQQPGSIYGFIGEGGSGKTFSATLHAFELAEAMRAEYVVFNYSLDARQLQRYFALVGYTWCLCLLRKNHILCRTAFTEVFDKSLKELVLKPDLAAFCQESNAVFVLDEMGIIGNAREWQGTSMAFLANLALARHSRRRLIWTAQFYGQADKQVAALTNTYILCSAWNRYNSKLQAPEMRFLFNRLYSAPDYQRIHKLADRLDNFKGFLYTLRKSKKTWFRGIDNLDHLLFSCFPSFNKFRGEEPTLINPLSVSYKKVSFHRNKLK